ncbi:MAG: hypothetical protein Q8891_03830 [Bacteroidota bacterium]|nr:hypothetical protein [Bacteroidota bacterium]
MFNNKLNIWREIKLIKNPFLLFLPFLILYIILVLIFPSNGTTGDESRYLIYSQYMVNGHLPPSESGFEFFGNGPGYSIILIPFIALHLPLFIIPMMNAVLYYFSIILLFKSLTNIASFRTSLIVSMFWALYYNSYDFMILILPETLAAFLICLLIFSLTKAFQNENSKKYIYLSGFVFGYLALTKPIFGYVLLFILIGSGLLWIIRRKITNYQKAIFISLIAMATTLPYLVCTYHVTGKIFYWSSLGGNNLYWMTTPYEGEYGDWLSSPKSIPDTISHQQKYDGFEKFIKSDRDLHISEYNALKEANHKRDYEEINKFKGGFERDDAFKRIAFNNIKSHPVKFIENCISNAGRMLFNFPFSYKLQTPRTLIRIPLGGTMAVLIIFCLIPTFTNWRKIIFPLRFMLFLALLYLGGSILSSAETRMFTVVVPLLLFWIGYILQKTVKINLRNW